MKWVLLEGVEKVVDRFFDNSSFYDANKDLQATCIELGRRQGCEMVNFEHSLGIYLEDIPLYNLTRVQRMEEAFYSLFYSNYLSELGFPLSTVDQLWHLVCDHVDGEASIICEANNKE
ncbi:unnamed protein product [Lactuca saligna]|uniref:Uncharacterized protein n=1 Tax=Lactuca saligna TaxID=75948 RepID=A0AA36EC19_LACSI|nr:unnamed protein product [Lactuca saligna]